MKICLTNFLKLKEKTNPLDFDLVLKEKDIVEREYPHRRLYSSLPYSFEK